jgi:hypothetical protein
MIDLHVAVAVALQVNVAALDTATRKPRRKRRKAEEEDFIFAFLVPTNPLVDQLWCLWGFMGEETEVWTHRVTVDFFYEVVTNCRFGWVLVLEVGREAALYLHGRRLSVFVEKN